MRGVGALLAGPLPVIHAVTDSTSVLQPGFVNRATRVMEALGKRGAVHLRCSRATGRQYHDIAVELVAVQNRTGCWLIVNDRADVARAVGSRGAQLASHSLQVSEALLVAPDMLIGASIHSVDEAVEAERAGALWCVAGTIFETPSHKGRPPARVEFLRMVAASVTLPIVAIGGVKPENVAELIGAGAYGVATIRGAAWDGHDDFVEPITRYISAYDSVSGSGHNDHLDGERSTT